MDLHLDKQAIIDKFVFATVSGNGEFLIFYISQMLYGRATWMLTMCGFRAWVC